MAKSPKENNTPSSSHKGKSGSGSSSRTDMHQSSEDLSQQNRNSENSISTPRRNPQQIEGELLIGQEVIQKQADVQNQSSYSKRKLKDVVKSVKDGFKYSEKIEADIRSKKLETKKMPTPYTNEFPPKGRIETLSQPQQLQEQEQVNNAAQNRQQRATRIQQAAQRTGITEGERDQPSCHNQYCEWRLKSIRLEALLNDKRDDIRELRDEIDDLKSQATKNKSSKREIRKEYRTKAKYAFYEAQDIFDEETVANYGALQGTLNNDNMEPEQKIADLRTQIKNLKAESMKRMERKKKWNERMIKNKKKTSNK